MKVTDKNGNEIELSIRPERKGKLKRSWWSKVMEPRFGSGKSYPPVDQES